jgi:hypothetical protein
MRREAAVFQFYALSISKRLTESYRISKNAAFVLACLWLSPLRDNSVTRGDSNMDDLSTCCTCPRSSQSPRRSSREEIGVANGVLLLSVMRE